MAKKKTRTTHREPVQPKRAQAGPCDRNPSHLNTRIFSVHGRVRYCVCDDCGHRWKMIVSDDEVDLPDVAPLVDYCTALASTLEKAEAVPAAEGSDEKVVVLDETFARDTAKQLLELAAEVSA